MPGAEALADLLQRVAQFVAVAEELVGDAAQFGHPLDLLMQDVL